MDQPNETSQEEWRAVPGLEGAYEVSSAGRVRSLPRQIFRSHTGPYAIKGRMLTAVPSKSGHLGIVLGGHYKGSVARLVYLAFNGTIPKHMDVDHKDRNRLNNHPSNLRLATRSQNLHNAGPFKTNKSGYRGVSWKKRRNTWVAVITVKGKYLELGYFKTKEDAARAYNRASFKYFGEFGFQNIIPQLPPGAS